MEGKELINLLIAVIRYFGGVKLGAGGLTRAYGNTAKRVIEAAETYAYMERVNVGLTLDYSRVQHLEYALKKLDATIVKQDYAEHVHLFIRLPAERLDALLKSCPGN